MQSVINTSVKLSPELRDRVKQLAAIRNQSVHSVMLQAIEKYVAHEEKREAFRQEGIKAYEEFVQTGLHVTGQEVDDWIDRIKKGERAEFPKCHI